MRIEVLKSEIKTRGGFIIPQVTDGFEQFPYQIITGGGIKLLEILKNLKELNGEENSYVDFYYELLSSSDQERVRENLTKEGKLILERFLSEGKEKLRNQAVENQSQENQDSVYFQLTDDMLLLSAELSGTESLFSTFYFCKYPMIVWSNYEHRHPVFYQDEQTMKSLQKLGFVFDKETY